MGDRPDSPLSDAGSEKTEKIIQREPEPERNEDGKIGDSWVYDDDDLLETEEGGLPRETVELIHSFGVESGRRNNLHYIAENKLIYAAGSSVVLLELLPNNELKKTYLHSHYGGSVGAICVHPSKKFFAVAERGSFPNIFIYHFPSLKVMRILRRGTEEAYSDVSFCASGTKLASVGAAPDFMLTVWDWQQEKAILKAKAFSQEVFKVEFSGEDGGTLITSGTGHIRFWIMANTFTGLKLQGEIGKFGNVEISDIPDFIQMPDGVVLTGAESGHILMWDEHLVQCEIGRNGGKSCHEGMIECIFRYEEKETEGSAVMDIGMEESVSQRLITAGRDGYVRVWDGNKLQGIDLGDHSTIALHPLEETRIAPKEKKVEIVSFLREQDHWMIQDACGSLWKVDSETKVSTRILSFHAGSVNACEASPTSAYIASTGEDGTVRLYAYREQQSLRTDAFNSAGTTLVFAPQALDEDGRTLAVGFADGVIRVFVRGRDLLPVNKETKDFGTLDDYLALKNAFKPHTQRVTALSYSPDGRILASASTNGILFFLDALNHYDPIGFLDFSKQKPVGSNDEDEGDTVTGITQIVFRDDAQSLLVMLTNHLIFEVKIPDGGSKNDETGTYILELEELKVTVFDVVNAVKLHLLLGYRDVIAKAMEVRKAEEQQKLNEMLTSVDALDAMMEEAPPIEEEEENDGTPRAKTPGAPKQERPQSAKIRDSLQKEAQEMEDEWEPSVGERINCVLIDQSKVILAIENSDYLYEFEFENWQPLCAIKLLPQHAINTAPKPLRIIPGEKGGTHYIKQSRGGDHLLTGGIDGTVSVRSQKDPSVMWRDGIHSGLLPNSEISLGASCAAWSFDDAHVMACGYDGSIFVLRLTPIEEKPALEGPEPRWFAAVADITDENHYSIEEAKRKSEEDRMIEEAEQTKEDTRQRVAAIREEYLRLLRANEKAPLGLQLTEEEREIDPNLRASMQEELEKTKEQTRKKMARKSEYVNERLARMKRRFFDDLACERIEVHAIKEKQSAATFRTLKLSDELKKIITEFRQKAQEAKAGPSVSQDQEGIDENKGFGEEAEERVKTPVISGLGNLSQTLSGVGKGDKANQQAEIRKAQRKAREAMWEEFMARKPDLDVNDPMDQSIIDYAEANNFGYKLKMEEGYVVPEDRQVNVERKRRELVLLEEFVYQVKMDYNDRLVGLRDLKERIIKRTKDANKRIERTNQILGIQEELFQPEMLPEEHPERRFEVPDETISAAKLKLTQAKEKTWNLLQRKVSNASAAMGAMSLHGFELGEGGSPQEHRLKDLSPIEKLAIPLPNPNNLELAEMQAAQTKLLFEKQQLLMSLDAQIEAFDKSVIQMRWEGIRLEGDLMHTNLMRLVLYRELSLLNQFESEDLALAAQLRQKKIEKNEVAAKIMEIQTRTQAKADDIRAIKVQQDKILEEALQVAPEDHAHHTDLISIFKKKVKRQRRGDDNDDDMSSSENLSLDDYDEDEVSESDLADDVCPEDCPMEDYEKILELREKRLDTEDEVTEMQKGIELLKKENDPLMRQAKIINDLVEEYLRKIKEFNTKRQQRLNELNAVVALRLDQIQCLVDNNLPSDTRECCVFTQSGIQKLIDRAKEREEETQQLKVENKEYTARNSQLQKDKKVKNEKIEELETRCNDIQILKFGQTIDLESLERMTVNKQADNIKKEMEEDEKRRRQEIVEITANTKQLRAQLVEETNKNTVRMQRLAELQQTQMQLETGLNASQSNLVVEYTGTDGKAKRERKDLQKRIQEQQEEILAYRMEIARLSRKDGWVYAPQGTTPDPAVEPNQ